MKILAFAGTRFADDLAGGDLACPPYDQIDAELRDRLHQTPLQFAHLVRPVSTDRAAHRSVAELHDRWLSDGVLTVDPTPSIYPYEIVLDGGGRRLGICVLVEIEDGQSGIIRPHEATVPKTVAERLSLLEATAIDLEPILMLAEDEGSLNGLVAADLQRVSPLVEYRDGHGNRHRLYRLTDPDRIGAYQDRLAPCVGLIADGHHRYTVAQRYASADPRRGGAAAAKMAILSSVDAPALQIDPIHRQIEGPPSLEPALGLVARTSTLEIRTGAEIADAVARTGQPAIAVGRDSTTIEIWEFDAQAVPSSLPSHLQHLAVGWLHQAVLPALGMSSSAATDGTITYRSDPDVLLEQIRRHPGTTGFWLPPMSGAEFRQAMATGHLLPPKSTRFLPKVASGLVWARHDCEIR